MLSLITGANGFIGSHLTRFLIERGEQVRVLVRPQSDRRLLQGPPVEFAYADLRDADSLSAPLQGAWHALRKRPGRHRIPTRRNHDDQDSSCLRHAGGTCPLEAPASLSPRGQFSAPRFRGLFRFNRSLCGACRSGCAHAHHFDDLTMHLTPSLGIVTGVAAGLKREWRPGDLLVARSVSDPEGSAGIPASPHLVAMAEQCGARPAHTLLTLPRIARTLEEKTRLAARGDAADMESLPLIKQWSARAIPSLALRVILDPVETPMRCDFEAAMDGRGQVRITRILVQLAHHPQLLPDFLHLAGESRRTLKILAGFLDRFIEYFDAHPFPHDAAL